MSSGAGATWPEQNGPSPRDLGLHLTLGGEGGRSHPRLHQAGLSQTTRQVRAVAGPTGLSEKAGSVPLLVGSGQMPFLVLFVNLCQGEPSKQQFPLEAL